MRKSLLLGLIVLLVVAACSPATPTVTVPTVAPTSVAPVQPTAQPSAAVATDGVQLPEVNPLEVTGPIVTAGSSTVYPLSEAIAEMFRDEGYADNLTIDSIGSGAGFERFCATGETDIANASRPIKASEVDSCGALGRDVLEFRIGTDALAVVVSKDNTFLTDVSMEQLARIFSAAYVKWSDVDPSWPAENILRFSPGTDSGTFDYFVEEVLGKEKSLLLDAPNLQLSEDDNVLVQGILGSPYAIGYFGYAYYVENADSLTALSIDGVEPNAGTVDRAEYPLARPLFLYSSRSVLAQKPQVAAFINYYLTNVNSVIERVGYFAASEEALNASKQVWLEAMGQ
ncbi:MAG: PstS family phosphate ABC transporter substrate-binding protein [Chloroflexi bacterium]|nr:PstS family phosphate ABC transporter substrate-binding protein [Chloroflexota bacterium]